MYKHIFVEKFRDGYPLSIFNNLELEFVKSKKLIDIIGNHFFPLFVGELITPENKYFSLPKNFQPTLNNVELFKKVLSDFRNYEKDGQTLISNLNFDVSKEGKLSSEKVYFEKLKNYFLDYITYEYIYPEKKVTVHSPYPITGGKLDVLKTIRNRERFGKGLTYKIKDVKNSEKWNIDDIYWSTLNKLAKDYATPNDLERIEKMEDFLKSEGYILNEIPLDDTENILKDIKKCDVGIIHYPIKNVLLAYYQSFGIIETFSINAFYTKNFAFVWEELVRRCLHHNTQFKEDLTEKFNRDQIRIKWFPNEESFNEFILKEKITDFERFETINGVRIQYKIPRVSNPDLFSSYKGKKFIGDAKYYQDPENANFDKEFRTYNMIIENEYPMVVFIPAPTTRVLHAKREGDLELIIFSISVKQAIKDAVEGTTEVIDKVHTLLYQKNYTIRQ
jgi:hypothetical protein